ncbi:MAG: ATP-binding region ATPase domain protein [Gemmatimonadetes bacterium]|nr:ATP-binding region ATPase domain protein [Gemmatimonadota bacterium]
MHEADALRSQIDRLSGQLTSLGRRAGDVPAGEAPLVQETIGELQTAVEELRVSEEEMRVAAEELALTQDALYRERQRYWALFHTSPDACFLTDADGVVSEVNRAGGALVGVDESRMAGKPLAVFVAEADRPRFRRWFTSDHRAQDDEQELTLAPRGRAPVVVGFRAIPFRADERAPAGMLCVARDLTEERAAREQARQLAEERIARREAERANRVKSDFLAVMSHELRTPLTSIMAYTELLQMGIPAAVPDAAQQHLSCIDDASRHLLLLIEEILGFARLEAGREEVKPIAVDLRELVGEVRTLLQPLADKRGLESAFTVPDHPVEARTDRAKVRQVLVNLVSNAVKFTPRGSVTLALEAEGADAVFRVRDTGVGIAPEHVDRIFEPFWQAQQGTTRAVSGTGLGLSIAQKIAVMLGGDLRAESSPGQGTTITFRLPLAPPAEQPAGPAAAA